MEDITEHVQAYLKTLSPESQFIYQSVEQLIKEAADTMSDEFQILASIMDLYWDRALKWRNE